MNNPRLQQLASKIYSKKFLFFLLTIVALNRLRPWDKEEDNKKQCIQADENFCKAASDLPHDASTTELITRNGYPVETHEIQTADNYILTAHRIPYGRTKESSIADEKKTPVYLLHGNFQSSADWVLNSRVDNCLGFVLADAGFDVWLGNARGNIYSNKHVHLSSTQASFWNFSMDEAGKYDVPATIDYILEKTQQPKLHYIAYSLGTTPFYMALARNAELNKKIALHISYAPTVFFKDYPLLPGGFLAPFVGVIQFIHDLIGGVAVPSEGLTHVMAKFLPLVCNTNVDIFGLCRYLAYLFRGLGLSQTSREQMPNIVGHFWKPTSLKVMMHSSQMINNHEFTPYDYGPIGNEKEYGQATVPHYNLGQITAPIALMLAESDIFVTKKVSDQLANSLPNLVEHFVVPNPEFAHLDFCYGRDANELVYNHTVQLLLKYS